jgi:hypothetical protein
VLPTEDLVCLPSNICCDAFDLRTPLHALQPAGAFGQLQRLTVAALLLLLLLLLRCRLTLETWRACRLRSTRKMSR